jgi:TetR/AcrR family transcriptional regulator, mexJK operon transcriptional repressor
LARGPDSVAIVQSGIGRLTASKIGRPTREEAAARQLELLDAAAGLFLELGYDAVTMEQIAGAVGTAKKTIYSKHADKAALFRATVQHAIDRMTETQAATLRSLDGMKLKDALTQVARMRLQQVTSPVGVRLQRIINAEARRFPDLFSAASEQVTMPVVSALAAMLSRHAGQGTAALHNPELAAAMFLSMVAGAPSRVIASGGGVGEGGMEERISLSVDIFLRGVGLG